MVQWVDRVLPLGELNVQGIKTTIAALAKAVDTSPRAVLVVTSPEPGHDAFQNATAILTEIMSDLVASPWCHQRLHRSLDPYIGH